MTKDEFDRTVSFLEDIHKVCKEHGVELERDDFADTNSIAFMATLAINMSASPAKVIWTPHAYPQVIRDAYGLQSTGNPWLEVTVDENGAACRIRYYDLGGMKEIPILRSDIVALAR